MKRIFRATLGLAVIASLLTPGEATAVSSTPSAVCSGANCTVTFPYTGDYYLWVAPATGTYTFEVWGAQGGNAAYGASVTTYGGKGGYATGSISLTAGQNVYVYVGGQGEGGGTATQNKLNGGFNGGGFGYNGSDSINRGGGGGGATDIRTTSNALSNRVIVGGGGAGGAYYPAYGTNYPGVGGGAAGVDGAVTNYNSPQYQGKGGTQSAGGAGGNNGSVGTAGQPGLGGDAGHAYGFSEAGGGGGYYGGGASGTGMAGGGGSGYVGGVTATQNIAGNGTMPDPAGGNVTGRSGNGVARITYANATNPTAFSTSQTTPTNTSSPISYSLTFSQIVNTVANADFANSGTATGCAFSISAASGTSFTLSVSSCGAGTLVPKLLAGSIYGTVSGTSGPVSDALTSSPITIDRTAPAITSVAPPLNSTYRPSEVVTLTTYFSESITVTGNPRMQLTVGALTRYAVFNSLIDSKTASFRYTVTTSVGEFDTDGISVSTTLDLNGGSISDIASNSLTPLTFTAPTLSGILVAQAPSAPTIDSITATNGTLTVYFTAGATNGSPLTSYHFSTDDGATWKNRVTGATESPIVISVLSSSSASLTNGVSYPIRIRTVNSVGSGDSSTAVTATPSAIAVSGDASLTLTYGNTASTGSYSATGGTNTYTWSLGSSISGVTLSGTTVTASNTLGAGTYSQTVRAADGNSQVGTKTLTITVNKASTSIAIALPNSATNAALGGAVTITATVPRAGAVNFKLGGSTISGCGSAAAASTSATCSWTPGSLGSVSLTAIFTPTDSSNYETSTTTTLSITVVNGVSSVTLSLTGGVTETPKSKTINIIAAVDQAGKLTILIDGKRLVGCFNKSASVGNVTCAWKPAVQKRVTITASLNPTNSVYNNSSSSIKVWVVRRSGTR
jgi:hypothetical protein